MQFYNDSFFIFSQVAAKEMKKKKQKQRFKEIEKRCLEKEMDVMKAYTDKPVQEHVSFILLYSTVQEKFLLAQTSMGK